MAAKPRLPPIDLEKVEQLAAQGLTQEQIADCLGMSPRAYHYSKSSDAEIAAAVKRGQAKGVAVVTNKLFEAARGGQAWAICFYMKTRGGWSEKHVMEHTGKDGAPMEITRRIIDGKATVVPDGD